MSIAIAVKVSDGLVLASDSSTSIVVTEKGRKGIAQVYENADKITQLGRLPVGIATWGIGNLQSKSITRLVEEFGEDYRETDSFEKENLEALADYFGDLYQEQFKNLKEKDKSPLGLAVGGIIDDSDQPILYKLSFPKPGRPELLRGENNFGASWFGQIDAITRLHKGYDPRMREMLKDKAAIPDEEINDILSSSESPVFFGGMPLQDAIEFADYLITVTKNFYKFQAGPPTCGGPTDIAVISKGGFQWIRRKHLSV